MFYYCAFALVARAKKRKKKGKRFTELSNFFATKEDMYPEEGFITRLGGDNVIINAAARQIPTNSDTYLKTTFESRLRKVVIAKLPPSVRPGIANAVVWHVKGMPRYAMSALDEEQEAIVDELRALIVGKNVEPGVELDDKWLKENIGRVVVFFAWIMDNFDELKLRDPKGMKRRFNLLPISSQKSHFIAIITVVMRQIMLDSGMINTIGNDQTTFNKSITKHMNAVFDTSPIKKNWKKVEGRKCDPDNEWPVIEEYGFKKFGDTIETYGVSVCFYVTTWVERTNNTKPPAKKKRRTSTLPACAPSASYEETNVIGVDPGRSIISSIVPMVKEVDANGNVVESWKKCMLTREQFYRDSHVKKNLLKLHRLDRNEISDEVVALSEQVSKTASVQEFENYIKTKKNFDARLWEHRPKRCFGLMTMDDYIHKRKTMDRFWKRTVCLEKDTIVAYGDAGFASSDRGESSVPTLAMMKSARRFSNLMVEVDEFRTSKTYCVCGENLLPIRIPGES